MALKDLILNALVVAPGLSDRELADRVLGSDSPRRPVNHICRQLQRAGKLNRRVESDGLLGNYVEPAKPGALPDDDESLCAESPQYPDCDPLAEDSVKHRLVVWLMARGWHPEVAWGAKKGPDVVATRGAERWIVESKGRGRSRQQQGNYFLAVLGQLLTRIDNPAARYSIALPDLPGYRGLWQRLPGFLKHRLHLSALFVDDQGNVTEDAVAAVDKRQGKPRSAEAGEISIKFGGSVYARRSGTWVDATTHLHISASLSQQINRLAQQDKQLWDRCQLADAEYRERMKPRDVWAPCDPITGELPSDRGRAPGELALSRTGRTADSG